MILPDVLHETFNSGADGGARQTMDDDFGVRRHHELVEFVRPCEHLLLRHEVLGVGGPEVKDRFFSHF